MNPATIYLMLCHMTWQWLGWTNTRKESKQ